MNDFDINGSARRSFFNEPHPYAPYVIYPQEGTYGRTYHVRGPGSIEPYPWPSRDAAENYAQHMLHVFYQGGVVETAGNA